MLVNTRLSPRLQRVAKDIVHDPAKVKAYASRAVRKLRRRADQWRDKPRGADVLPPAQEPAQGADCSVLLPSYEIPSGPISRPGLRVAVILDSFSALAFSYEWNQVQITPSNWRRVMEEHQPDLFFAESVWKGEGNWWMPRKPGDPARKVIADVVQWCRDHEIPTVFWNKEDPPNYERFIATAALFDQVFTVDADRIPDYKKDLGHERVGLLPFAAQPRIHNPVRRGEGRSRAVAFAGTYLRDKYPDRRRQTEYLLDAAKEFGLDIYSRVLSDDDRYTFPAHLRDHVVGSLPYEKMLAAYTAYKVFLNVNSVTNSPTMCARRLFELSAAQTPVVSGPSAAIEPFFGETVSVADSGDEATLALRVLIRSPDVRDRTGLLAHRRVFDSHLYRHRVDTVLQAAEVNREAVQHDDSVSAIVPTVRPHQMDNILDFMSRQRHEQIELVLITHGFEPDRRELEAKARDLGIERLVVRPAESSLTLGTLMNLGVECAGGRYVAKMDDDNYYGANYLTDLVRSFLWTDAAVVGKWAHYVHLQGPNVTLLRFAESEHRYVKLVQGGTIVTERQTAAQLQFENLPRRVDTTFLEKVARDGGKVYSGDRFNYISRRSASPDGHTWPIQDRELLGKKMSQVVMYGDPVDHVTV